VQHIEAFSHLPESLSRKPFEVIQISAREICEAGFQPGSFFRLARAPLEFKPPSQVFATEAAAFDSASVQADRAQARSILPDFKDV